MSVLKVRLLGLLTAATMALLTTLAVAPAANALTYSSWVHLGGHVWCLRPVDTPRLIQVWSGSEYNQAGFNWLGNYGMDFRQVPPNGVWSSALITCDGWQGRYQFWRGFQLNRPMFGDASASFSG